MGTSKPCKGPRELQTVAGESGMEKKMLGGENGVERKGVARVRKW